MELVFKGKTIKFSKELSTLDKLVVRFTKTLEKQGIDYAIISGYIAVLFGRSRETEDVDLFVEEISLSKMTALWTALDKAGFECLNAFSPKEALEDYLQQKLAIRFALKGTFIPNFEVKFPKTKYNTYSLKNKLKVLLSKEKIFTSEIELQIAFKLKLGSEKDFEDARHLYNLFKEHLNHNLLRSHISELGVEKEAKGILWES